MGVEIERKFLVKSGVFRDEAKSQYRIKQGYISSLPERTVRVRIVNGKGFLTIKGVPDSSGTTRYEWESELPLSEAEELLRLCEPGSIDKTRYIIAAGDFKFEVDEFHGENEGLIVAEIELNQKDDYFIRPHWLGEEVTGIRKYYNSCLIKNPYSNWLTGEMETGANLPSGELKP
jgi:adenylate cyclase